MAMERGMQDQSPDLWVMIKAMAASAGGRALLLLSATRSEAPTLAKIVGVLLYEIPVVCAFALLGWHVAGLFGARTDEWRITVTMMLAWAGQRGLDLVLQRVFPPKPGG